MCDDAKFDLVIEFRLYLSYGAYAALQKNKTKKKKTKTKKKKKKKKRCCHLMRLNKTQTN